MKIISKRGRQKAVNLKPEEISEIQRCTVDPVYFIDTYFQMQHPLLGTIQTSLYQYQVKYVQQMVLNDHLLAMQPRQAGATMVGAAFLLWEALFTPNQTIVFCGHDPHVSTTVLERIVFAAQQVPAWLRPKITRNNRIAIEFSNGSKIICTPASPYSLVGLSYDRIFLDNFAYLQPRLQDDIWLSIVPNLSRGALCIVSSPPNGVNNVYFRAWQASLQGIGIFKTLKIALSEVPQFDSVFRTSMKRMIGDEAFKAQFECEFA